jgi:transcription elongation factor Elf1
MKYIKSDEEYIEQYDSFTVNMCRDFLKRQLIEIDPKKEVTEETLKDSFKNVWINVGLEFYKAELYSKKKQTIEEWKQKDIRRDTLLDSTEWRFKDITCLKCGDIMEMNFKDLEERDSLDNAKVLFMFSCGKSGHHKRAFYNTGEEYIPKEPNCVKCGKVTTSTSSRKGDVITTVYLCGDCEHKEVDTFELSSNKVDPHFEEDKARFCLSEKEGNAALMGMTNLEQYSKNQKDREDNKEMYDKMAKVEKVTILELEKRIAEAVEKNGYVRFHFRDPEKSPNVEMYVPFVTYDNKKDRTSLESTHDLAKKLKGLLKGTNWRLMTDGVNYRAGILEGRLRVYDTQSELSKLVS